jgi:hypothetical protein
VHHEWARWWPEALVLRSPRPTTLDALFVVPWIRACISLLSLAAVHPAAYQYGGVVIANTSAVLDRSFASECGAEAE